MRIVILLAILVEPHSALVYGDRLAESRLYCSWNDFICAPVDAAGCNLDLNCNLNIMGLHRLCLALKDLVIYVAV